MGQQAEGERLTLANHAHHLALDHLLLARRVADREQPVPGSELDRVVAVWPGFGPVVRPRRRVLDDRVEELLRVHVDVVLDALLHRRRLQLDGPAVEAEELLALAANRRLGPVPDGLARLARRVVVVVRRAPRVQHIVGAHHLVDDAPLDVLDDVVAGRRLRVGLAERLAPDLQQLRRGRAALRERALGFCCCCCDGVEVDLALALSIYSFYLARFGSCF